MSTKNRPAFEACFYLCSAIVGFAAYCFFMNTLAVIEAPTSKNAISHGYSNRALTVQETEAIRYHLSNSRSRNTRLAYAAQWKLFVSFCKQEGFLPFPAEVNTIVLYLNHIAAKNNKYSKMEQAVSAIKAVHSDNIHLLPPGSDALQGLSFRHPHIRAALSSIRRDLVDKGLNVVKKPKAFSQSEILAMVRACPDTPSGVQDKAILLLGMNVGLRASEFCALETDDIIFDTDMGVDVRIRSSKTDQHGVGENLYVGRLAPSQKDFDAVLALQEWMCMRSALELDGVASLFVAFRKGGSSLHKTKAGTGHGLTREAITTVVQRCASRAGIEVTNQSISSHSCRHSMITQAFTRPDIDAVRLSKTTRHRSMEVLLGYDQTSRRTSTIAPKLWA